MTRFEKDVIEIEEGNEIEVLKEEKQNLMTFTKKADAKRIHSEDSALHRNTQES